MENNSNTGSIVNDNIAQSLITPREDLINTAVTFLRNPKVIRSPLSQKQNFLRSKGLSENEIQLACERAGVFTDDPNSSSDKTIINIERHSKNNYVVPEQTTLGKIKEYIINIALISGVTYAIYLFYKRFIEPFLFGRKKKKTINESLEEIEQKIDSTNKIISTDLQKVREDLDEIKKNENIAKDFQCFKNDLDAIKGLLLNRKQFSSPLVPTVPPSIPAWQLNTQQQRKSSENSENDKNDDINETGSGSGSSETEVVNIDQTTW